MTLSLQTACLLGVNAVPVTVEVDALRRLPSVAIVGLPSLSVRESADRVRSALLASGFDFPRQRLVISLAPADLRKDGTGFDLPIAVAVLAVSNQVPEGSAAAYLFAGELTLGGEIRPVRGALAFATAAKALGLTPVLPPGMAEEAALVPGLVVRVARTLREVADFLAGTLELPAARPVELDPGDSLDFRDVRGQPAARVALEVAAAGGHGLLLEGPPGCGKTMLAARLPGILPPMTEAERLDCTRIHSAAGLLGGGGLVQRRPFRAPHHSISPAGLVGGALLRPGEASLAHNGVLFLDEFPEFPRFAREALRAPVEDGTSQLVRAGGSVTMPAKFLLVAAANPCPCGNLGHPTRPCVCGESARDRYVARLEGPLAEALALRVELSPVPAAELLNAGAGEGSAEIRARVVRARCRQEARLGPGRTNADIDEAAVVEVVLPDAEARDVLRRILQDQGLGERAGRRILRVARTIADLDEEERGVTAADVSRAAAFTRTD